MEVFMCNIAHSTTKNDLIQELAAIFHGPGYDGFGPLPLNFDVRLQHNAGPQRQGGSNHNGKGFLTLPYQNVTALFLLEYGHHNQEPPRKKCMFGTRMVKFFPGQHEPRAEVIKKIRREPYIDPTAAEQKECREPFITENIVPVKSFSFGWLCRDYVYSPEWELPCTPTAKLSFNLDRREIRIRIRPPIPVVTSPS